MMLSPRYQQTLDYLFSFVDYSLKKADQLAAANFDLGRMRQLMAALGNPQDAYPTIHIAGTKGKGSTSALCASALQAAGHKTGLYTSPHLLDFCERIQVDGQPIPQETLADLVDEIRPVVAGIAALTTFEITTALGFLYFARAGCSAAVIEVGLGGRLDATNVVTPRVSVITALSYDHTAVLGNTLAKIAGEKAGIIKPGVPVVSSPQKDEALEVLERVAQERGCALTLVGRDVTFQPGEHNLGGQTFSVNGQSLSIRLLGAHQIENAATAYAALWQSNLGVTEETIRRGFAQAEWPCRFEIASAENPTLILDSAHNEDSFLRLAQTLQDYFPTRKVALILGVSEDKYLLGMIAALKKQTHTILATRSLHPRALEPEKIVEAARQLGVGCEAAAPVETALQRGLEIARRDGLILLSAGSMFVTAEVKEAWKKQDSVAK